jgi:hypothetical protein
MLEEKIFVKVESVETCQSLYSWVSLEPNTRNAEETISKEKEWFVLVLAGASIEGAATPAPPTAT